MSVIPNISEAEWEIIKILWKESPLIFTEIRHRIDPSHNWKENTIHTLLSRLVKKGALEVVETKPVKKYVPLVSEDQCVISETESFIERIYNGAVNNLVAGFIKNKKLSKEELKELKDMLDKADLED